MKNNSLGDEISKLRKELSMTQNQLCKDICTQPTISMIEKGTIIPSLEIILKLSLRLKKPLNYFTNILLFNDYDYVNQFVNDIEELTLIQKHQSVYTIVKKELLNKNHDEWFRIFLQWQLYLSSYRLNYLDIDTSLLKIKNLLNKSTTIILQHNFLNIRILNSIAFLYALKKDYTNSLIYFNKISEIPISEVSPRLNQHTYSLRVLYNKTKTLYDMGNYELAIETCIEGIDRSTTYENMSLIGNFYYYLGQCYEKLNYSKDKITFVYQKAFFFFEVLNRELYLQIIKTEKAAYLKGH